MNTPQPLAAEIVSAESTDRGQRDAQVSLADQQAFDVACQRLRNALQDAANGVGPDQVADARVHLRSLAVKLRDAGFWRSDKHGLRSTVSLLWEADRYVNEQALNRPNPSHAGSSAK